MSTKIADIFASLSLDSSSYDSGISAAQGKAGVFGNVLQGIFQGIGQRLFTGIVDGLETVVSKMGNAVQASSDLNESINKTSVIFGDSAQEILDWSSASATAFGLSQNKALDAAGSFGALFRQMGQTSQQAAMTSENLVTLAADLGSIYNQDPSIVLEKLQSGLAGASRPLRELNIFLTENAVNEKAVQLGLAASTDAVSESAKVNARYALIIEQAKIAQGDFSRTSHDLANEQRILAAEIEDGAASLGNVFRPVITSITDDLITIAPQMFQYATNIMDQFASGLAAGITALLPVISEVSQLFTYWFKPGSPPRVLPDIAKWGKATMQVYLDSFASVDVKKAFDTVGSAIESILRSTVAAGKGSETGLVGSIFGSEDAIKRAVAEFDSAGSVSEATINRIVQSAGSGVRGVGDLVRAYFNLQSATTAATRAQDDLNRITEKYDAILSPLQGELDSVRAQQQKLADQQRLISAKNTLYSLDATEADKQAARLEIQQISLESQINGVEQQKKAESSKAQASLDAAKKQEDAAKKQLDAAQATIDQQIKTNTLLGEQRQLEKRLADERKAEADKQARLAEQLHQAQLQYTLGIETTQQKIQTLRGELAKTTVGSVEYYNILGQIASLEKQAADEAKRNADKVKSAQLDYNLSLADTAGKIAIWQGELAKATPGTAEYFQILTKIHDLNVQLAKENAKAGLGDIGASLGLPTKTSIPKDARDDLLPQTGAQQLLDTVKKVRDAINGPKGDVPDWMVNLKKFLKEDLPGAFKPVLDAINDLVDTIKKRFPELKDNTQQTLGVMGKLWKEHGGLVSGLWKLLWDDIGHTAEFGVNIVTGIFTTFVGIITLNWKKFTKGLGEIWGAFWTYGKEIGETEAKRIRAFLDEFFPGVLDNVRKFVKDSIAEIEGLYTRFEQAGKSIIKHLLDGLKSAGGGVSDFFKGLLGQSITNQLPGSEPKDPTSPLARLDKRGEALINNFHAGMKAASLNIRPLTNSLLPAGATTNNSTSNMNFTINISGGNADTVGKNAKDGILQALRAVGMA